MLKKKTQKASNFICASWNKGTKLSEARVIN